ncbi:hypothetical protein OPT61_g2483 [Boeremia exigua]|uniref:Uncharacterized protein n=1 Tax=Boeremia exigua TaxID=749465 RepID=A0ACC2ILC7_9PLEO|nr:hypothetical protein OPT61_g2483 [Boeremia exigua]
MVTHALPFIAENAEVSEKPPNPKSAATSEWQTVAPELRTNSITRKHVVKILARYRRKPTLVVSPMGLRTKLWGDQA